MLIKSTEISLNKKAWVSFQIEPKPRLTNTKMWTTMSIANDNAVFMYYNQCLLRFN